MSYTVVLSRQAEHFFKKLDAKIKVQIRDCLLNLQEDACLGKRLHGDLKDKYSFRVGKTRIIYTVIEKEKTVTIIAIGQRSTIYQ